jgi:glycosyltransferase involved in cell wall biosynthesis
VRVLVVSNMLPDPTHPERGRFVRDQVHALRVLASPDGGRPLHPDRGRDAAEHAAQAAAGERLQVELFEFAPGLGALLAAARELRTRYRGQRFDVVHSHFSLSACPALAVRARARGVTLHGTDVTHLRTRALTRAVLPTMDLVAGVSEQLVSRIPGSRARARARVLPCGVDMERFKPVPRARARGALELDDTHPYLLLPCDPARPEKRHDRAQALAQAVGAQLLTLGGIDPERVPLYVNAANAVLIPSAREGFGLAALEALACEVPVLATPVGIHPQALRGVAGCLCAPFELSRWREAVEPHLASEDLRAAEGCSRSEGGRSRAERFSSMRMAQLLAEAWGSLLAAGG